MTSLFGRLFGADDDPEPDTPPEPERPEVLPPPADGSLFGYLREARAAGASDLLLQAESIPYARVEPDPTLVAGTMRRAEGADRVDILPIGRDELLSLLERHIAGGLTKFVLRPLTFDGWDAELDWLADVALPLQS